MKNLYLLILGLLYLAALSACTTAPKPSTIETTYECYGEDPNLQEPVTLKSLLQNNSPTDGVVLSCSGTTVIIDTVLDYGPEQANILDRTTGQWQTYTTKDCKVISYESF